MVLEHYISTVHKAIGLHHTVESCLDKSLGLTRIYATCYMMYILLRYDIAIVVLNVLMFDVFVEAMLPRREGRRGAAEP